MSYDPRTMFSDIAPKHEPSNMPWFKCSGCGNEYSKAILARGCEEAHVRYAQGTSMFPDVPAAGPPLARKSEVFWIDSETAICGLCSSKEKEADLLLRVETLTPPVCSKCQKQIEPPPEIVIANPNFLPPSERAEIQRLRQPRRDARYLWERRMHRQLGQIEAYSIAGDLPPDQEDLIRRAETLDGRLITSMGLYRDDPDDGLQRTASGYSHADPDVEPIEYEPTDWSK